MPQEARELVCMITRGTDHEISSVGFTIANGGITAGLTPCVKSRGYSESDLVDGVVITGASVMHERIKARAATLSF